MKNVDLSHLRKIAIENQNSRNAQAKDPAQQIIGCAEGPLQITEVGIGQVLSVVPQEIFAARLENDRRTASEKLPTNTTEITTDEGVTGFLYSFTSSFGYKFVMFAYFDGSYYQVKVIQPELEERWRSPHTGHIFSNGKICFGSGYNSGMPNLQDAFAKSVLWAEGISAAIHTGQFPFSANNLSN